METQIFREMSKVCLLSTETLGEVKFGLSQKAKTKVLD